MAFTSKSGFKKNCSNQQKSTIRHSSPSAQNFPLPTPLVDFVTVEDLEFYRAGSTSYRFPVKTIEGNAYVAISHWFFNRQQAAWFPTKKQIFLPKAAWFGLIENADRISDCVDTIPDREQEAALGGTRAAVQQIGLPQIVNRFFIFFSCFFIKLSMY